MCPEEGPYRLLPCIPPGRIWPFSSQSPPAPHLHLQHPPPRPGTPEQCPGTVCGGLAAHRRYRDLLAAGPSFHLSLSPRRRRKEITMETKQTRRWPQKSLRHPKSSRLMQKRGQCQGLRRMCILSPAGSGPLQAPSCRFLTTTTSFLGRFFVF